MTRKLVAVLVLLAAVLLAFRAWFSPADSADPVRASEADAAGKRPAPAGSTSAGEAHFTAPKQEAAFVRDADLDGAGRRTSPPPELSLGEVDVDELVEILEDSSNWQQRLRAVNALASLPPSQEIRSALFDALDDHRAPIRQKAAMALRHYPDESVIAALEKLQAHDPSEEVRRAAIDALASLRR